MLTPLDRRGLGAALARLQRERVEAVAVCYLHAYRDARHERLTAREITRRLPGVYVSLSSEVLPQIKEYERVWTTVVNAYVGPALAGYLARLAERLRGQGYRGELLIMQSHGGVAPVGESARLAAGAVLSGPAGGLAAGRHVARLTSRADLVTFDMGGTSTDIALLQGGEPMLTAEKTVGLARVALPSLDIHTLGAGALDPAGGRRRHPASAPRAPGGPRSRLLRQGWRHHRDRRQPRARSARPRQPPAAHRLDVEAARRAVGPLAPRARPELLPAAEGVARVVNTNMAEGIKLVSVRRGVDPRGFTLVAFGGAAGLHVTEVARLLEIRRVIVPNVAAVLSAWGMLATDLRYELVRSHVSEVGRLTAPRLRRLFAGLEAQGRRRLRGFEGAVDIRRALDMRYGEQIFEIGVPLDGVDLARADLLDEVAARFHRRHEELYAYSAPGQEVVIVNARVAVVGRLPVLPADDAVATGRALGPPARRRVWLGGWQEVPVHRLDALPAGYEIKGPALFESATTTVLIRDAEQATVTPRGWLDIQLG